MASLHNVYPFGTTATGEPKLPSDAWLRRFLRRHQDSLRFNRGSPLSYIRAMAATPRAFQSVYDTLRGRMNIPENVVMMDESAVPTKCGWERRVLGPPSSTPANIPGGSIDQHHLTLVAACTAAGQMLPSAYICAGKHILEVGRLSLLHARPLQALAWPALDRSRQCCASAQRPGRRRR
jgi:hypothetical protein